MSEIYGIITIPQTKWKLTGEKKTINNFTCYKATTSFISPNKKLTRKVTAWYCPDINFHFGPIGYGNLPGLIFELLTDSVTYNVRNITFKKEFIEIEKLEDYRKYSEQEIDELYKEYYEKYIKN